MFLYSTYVQAEMEAGELRHKHKPPCSMGMDTSLHDPQRGSSHPDGACVMQNIVPVMQNIPAMQNE